MNKTIADFEYVESLCQDIFIKKMNDYGLSWNILRPSSITDLIFIKANRIRSIEEKKDQKIDDNIENEFISIVNYSIMALIKLLNPDLNESNIINLYDEYMNQSKELMTNKNHDYDEIWRKMRISSFTDIILMKILRIKQIEDNNGKTIISEGLESNYKDIINYSIFALIRLTT